MHKQAPSFLAFVSLLLIATFATACGDDDGGPEADKLGVGAACTTNEDCALESQVCLQQFKGGYCGIQGCASDADCPAASACVAHTDNTNYCFRICADKAECNRNRPADAESNCSSSITFVEADHTEKACVPPSN